MPERETEPTMNADSPLVRGHRWLWIPVLTGTALSLLGQFFLQRLAGCR